MSLAGNIVSCHSRSRIRARCIIFRPEDFRWAAWKRSERPSRVLDFPLEVVGTALLSTRPTLRRLMLFEDKPSIAGVRNRVSQPIQSTGSQVLEVIQGRSRSVH